MKQTAGLVWVFVFAYGALLQAQTASNQPNPTASENYSGMYTFLKEGEFVQITIEDAGRVTGFVSRYGDSESDRGAFLDQFFKRGQLDGNKLSFTTETVHAVWYEFNGVFTRGSGKTPADEAYHVVQGTLTEFREDDDKKVSTQSRAVTFKSFPQNLDTPAHPKD